MVGLTLIHMTTTQVNRIHQPSNFVPSDYEYIDSFDSTPEPGQAEMMWSDEHQQLVSICGFYSRKLADSATSDWVNRGQCDHCGARIRYVAVLQHTSGDLVAFGHDCLSNRVGNYSAADFRMRFIQDAAKRARDEAARQARVAEFVAAHPEVQALATYDGPNDFFLSLKDQLGRKGSLSERQVEAFTRAVARNAERDAQRAADALTATPAPSGKVTVTGEVLSTKWQENDFGGCLKMLVRDDRGFKVWVSVPSSIAPRTVWDPETHEQSVTNLDAGTRVTFSATLEVSDRDETFAFGKRPTKAAIVA